MLPTMLAVQSSTSKELGFKIECPGLATVEQATPIQIQLYESEASIRFLSSGYKSLEKMQDGFHGKGSISPSPGCMIQFDDMWTVLSTTISVKRRVIISGHCAGGFYSQISLDTLKSLTYPDVNLFAPGMTYGSPDYQYDFAPAGMTNYRAGSFNAREDEFTIPTTGIYFKDGTSVALMNLDPRCVTTAAETHDRHTTMIEERFSFGGLGANELPQGGLSLAYWFPGSQGTRRRYHPLKDGFTQEYCITFRFGENETYHDFYRATWRWCWARMAPKTNHHDMAVVQKALVDHLAGLTLRSGDRVGIPFWTSMITGKNFGDAGLRDRDAVMGFVGKDLEGAAMLIRASYEETGSGARKYHQLGIDLIDSMIRNVTVSPLPAQASTSRPGNPH